MPSRHRGRSTALCMLDPGARSVWVFSAMPRPPGSVWMFAVNLAPTGFRTPDVSLNFTSNMQATPQLRSDTSIISIPRTGGARRTSWEPVWVLQRSEGVRDRQLLMEDLDNLVHYRILWRLECTVACSKNWVNENCVKVIFGEYV